MSKEQIKSKDKKQIKTNPNIDQAYILGIPIESEFGICRFVKVKDYFTVMPLLSVLKTDKNRIIANIFAQKEKDKANSESYQKTIEAFKKLTLYEIINQIPQLLESYIQLTNILFGEYIWDKVNNKNFDDLRVMLLAMNNISVPETSSNPEIQYYYDLSDKEDKEGIDFSTIVTSVALSHGYTYETINEMTFFQLNMAFKRTTEFKNFDTSTLFATVAEKVDITNWYKTIPILHQEEKGISRKQFDKEYGNMFDD